MALTLYHNPRCSKSRQTLELLKEQELEFTTIEYLLHPPEPAEIQRVLRLLGLQARELMRKGQSEYKDLGLDDKDLSETELIAAMHKHPILIERPILVSNQAARIGRPPESVLEILD